MLTLNKNSISVSNISYITSNFQIETIYFLSKKLTLKENLTIFKKSIRSF